MTATPVIRFISDPRFEVDFRQFAPQPDTLSQKIRFIAKEALVFEMWNEITKKIVGQAPTL